MNIGMGSVVQAFQNIASKELLRLIQTVSLPHAYQSGKVQCFSMFASRSRINRQFNMQKDGCDFRDEAIARIGHDLGTWRLRFWLSPMGWAINWLHGLGNSSIDGY